MPHMLKIDMELDKSRHRLWKVIQSYKGMIRVVICQWRERRSDRQNRFYWPNWVKPFAEYLRNQGDAITEYDAHNILKHRFLRVEIENEKTGELMIYTKSTTSLDTVEFNNYLDVTAAWLHDIFGFKFPDSSEYHERDKKAIK